MKQGARVRIHRKASLYTDNRSHEHKRTRNVPASQKGTTTTLCYRVLWSRHITLPPHPPTMPVGDSRVESSRPTTMKAGRRRRRRWILLPGTTSTARSRRLGLRLLTRRATTTLWTSRLDRAGSQQRLAACYGDGDSVNQRRRSE